MRYRPTTLFGTWSLRCGGAVIGIFIAAQVIVAALGERAPTFGTALYIIPYVLLLAASALDLGFGVAAAFRRERSILVYLGMVPGFAVLWVSAFGLVFGGVMH